MCSIILLQFLLYRCIQLVVLHHACLPDQFIDNVFLVIIDNFEFFLNTIKLVSYALA